MTNCICVFCLFSYQLIIHFYAIDMKDFILVHNLIVNVITGNEGVVGGGQADHHFSKPSGIIW